MRVFAMLFMCLVVALISGLALFLSITSKPQGVWLDALFMMALALTLVLSLSLIKRAASKSLISSFSERDEDPQRTRRDERDDRTGR